MINRILMRISVVVEPDDKKFFGWSPDLDGVLVEGDTIKETKSLLKEAILLHLETMFINNIPIPQTIIVAEQKSDKRDNKSIRGNVCEPETAELMMTFA